MANDRTFELNSSTFLGSVANQNLKGSLYEKGEESQQQLEAFFTSKQKLTNAREIMITSNEASCKQIHT